MRCWYTRWQMSNALDQGDLASRMARGHAAGCASCQAHARALTTLDARLSREAHTATAPVTAPRPRARWLLVAGPIAAGAAAAVVIAAGTAAPPPPPPPGPVAVQPPLTMPRVRGIADRVSQALQRTPLETELSDLIRDGKRGIDAILATGGLQTD